MGGIQAARTARLVFLEIALSCANVKGCTTLTPVILQIEC